MITAVEKNSSCGAKTSIHSDKTALQLIKIIYHRKNAVTTFLKLRFVYIYIKSLNVNINAINFT